VRSGQKNSPNLFLIAIKGEKPKSNEALKQESARREAAIKNMHRLRALRLARDAKLKNE
jgi:hypothetical protein